MLAPRRCEPAAAASLATRLPPLSPCHSGSNALLMRWHHNAAGSRRGPGWSASTVGTRLGSAARNGNHVREGRPECPSDDRPRDMPSCKPRPVACPGDGRYTDGVGASACPCSSNSRSATPRGGHALLLANSRKQLCCYFALSAAVEHH